MKYILLLTVNGLIFDGYPFSWLTINFESQDCVILHVVKSTKVGIHVNKAIHSTLEELIVFT